jgi:hypothetical protein
VRAIGALVALCIATVLLSGCAGTNPGNASAGPTANPGGATAAATGQTAAKDLPTFMMDFDRVCETQVGFGGAAAYDATAGLHPVALFTDHGDPPTLINSSVTFPAGWTVTEDADFANNSELAGVQLVACSRRTKATPNGTMCDFTPNDGGAAITLELTDTAYELTVYAASTGKKVGEPKTLEASDTECPMFASFKEGDTRYLNSPTEDQYVNALKGSVAL